MHNFITNVLCHHFEKELTDDICSNKLSLLWDESNDISIIKLLGVSIIYFSHSNHSKVVWFVSNAFHMIRPFE